MPKNRNGNTLDVTAADEASQETGLRSLSAALRLPGFGGLTGATSDRYARGTGMSAYEMALTAFMEELDADPSALLFGLHNGHDLELYFDACDAASPVPGTRAYAWSSAAGLMETVWELAERPGGVRNLIPPPESQTFLPEPLWLVADFNPFIAEYLFVAAEGFKPRHCTQCQKEMLTQALKTLRAKTPGGGRFDA